MRRKPLFHVGISLGIGLVVLMILFVLENFHMLETLELKTLDYRFVLRGPYTGLLGSSKVSNDSLDVVLVELNDESWRLIPAQWPYPREIWGRAVRNLSRAGAKVVVFDIMFDTADTSSVSGDSLFAAAIRAARNRGTSVVLAGKYVRENTRIPPEYIQKPVDPLLRAGSEVGLVNEYRDVDGFTRRYILFNGIPQDEEVYLSLGIKAVEEYMEIPDTTRLVQTAQFVEYGPLHIRTFGHPDLCLINFYGPPSNAGPDPPVGPWKTFREYPLSGVLDDAEYDLANSDEDTNWMELFLQDGALAELGLAEESPFQDKIVIVGVSLDDFHDVKETPFYQYQGYQHLMPGMETHANVAQMILHENYISELSGIVVMIIVILMVLAISLVTVFAKPMLGGVISLCLAWIYLDWSFGIFFRDYFWTIEQLSALSIGRIPVFRQLVESLGVHRGISTPGFGRSLYVPVILPLLGIVLSYGGNVLYQFVAERQEKRWIRDAFGHFLNPKVVGELMKDPGRLTLGGERRTLTVFFSDIEGFTTVSEAMDPEVLTGFLNEYLTELTELILSYDGIVDKYEGDAIMAEFGAPLPLEDHAVMACQTALDIQWKLNELRSGWIREGMPAIQTRIGINSGTMALGNFGSRGVFDYTVMGDAVNLGARLEGANKHYHTYIMISEFTHQLIEGEFVVRYLDSLVVKGKTKPVRVYELICRTGESEGPLLKNRELLHPYHQGITHYLQREWEAGLAAFEEALQIDSQDGPSLLFRERCLQYLDTPPPADWDGAFVLSEK